MDNNLPINPVPNLITDQPPLGPVTELSSTNTVVSAPNPAVSQPLPEIPVVPTTPKPNPEPLPIIETAPPINTFSTPKPKFNKNLIYILILVILISGSAFLIYFFSGNNQSVSIEDPNSFEVVEEPISETDKIAIAENVSLFSGTYVTNTQIQDSEIPDPESSEPDLPRRFARTLILNSDNTATMTSNVDEKEITESGKWNFNLNSKTIKVEFTTSSNQESIGTKIIIFDAVQGNTLVAQSYDRVMYPDTDIVFYKN